MLNSKVHNLNRMQGHTALCLCIVVAALALAGCSKRGEEVRFHRFEQLLFGAPTDQLPARLQSQQAEFDSELIVLFPDDPEFIQMTQGFVDDSVMRGVYHIVDSLYHDLSDVEQQLGQALSRAYRLCPKMQHVERFYTMVTGDFNYDFRVFSNRSDLCVCLDEYALGSMGKYQYFNTPAYLVRTCSHEHIVPDCLYTLAGLYIQRLEGEHTLLDYAIAEGKKLYFIEKAMPAIADSTLLRYTADQLVWMRENEKNVWGWLIQNKLLYSTDISLMRNLLNDAPHTNNFGAGSAPRTAHYIGWQIVKAYMKKSGATMEELMEETDSRKILTLSAWRP